MYSRYLFYLAVIYLIHGSIVKLFNNPLQPVISTLEKKSNSFRHGNLYVLINGYDKDFCANASHSAFTVDVCTYSFMSNYTFYDLNSLSSYNIICDSVGCYILGTGNLFYYLSLIVMFLFLNLLILPLFLLEYYCKRRVGYTAIN